MKRKAGTMNFKFDLDDYHREDAGVDIIWALAWPRAQGRMEEVEV